MFYSSKGLPPSSHAARWCIRVLPLILVAGLAQADSRTDADEQSELQVTLKRSSDPGKIRFIVRNEGRQPVTVLTQSTPLASELFADDFLVSRAAKNWRGRLDARYIGKMAKFAAPKAADFITIAGGEWIATMVDVADNYAVPEGGNFSVNYTGDLMIMGADTPSSRAGKQVSAVTDLSKLRPAMVDATGMSVGLAAFQPFSARAKAPAFDSCSAKQISQLEKSNLAADREVASSLSSLEETPVASRASSPRYNQWFGSYSAKRYAKVIGNYEKISNNLSTQKVTYECDNDCDSIAYVVGPGRFNRIYVCSAFFRLPIDDADASVGYNSQMGSIVHEMSHFSELVGASDFVYSVGGAADLADSNPDNAILNADNIEYFTENRPELPMVAAGDVPEPPVEEPDPVQPDDGNGSDEPGTPLDDGTVDEPTDEPEGPDSDSPDDDGYQPLASGQTITGRLSRGTERLYKIDDATRVELTSITGDADLYIFNAPDRSSGSLVCSANAIPDSGSNRDTCELNSGEVSYITVGSYRAGRFRLSVTGASRVSAR